MVATRTALGSNVFRTTCACDRGEGVCRRGEGGRVLASFVFLGGGRLAAPCALEGVAVAATHSRRPRQGLRTAASVLCMVPMCHSGVRGWRGQGWVAEGQRAQRLLVGLSSVFGKSPKSLLQIPFFRIARGHVQVFHWGPLYRLGHNIPLLFTVCGLTSWGGSVVVGRNGSHRLAGMAKCKGRVPSHVLPSARPSDVPPWTPMHVHHTERDAFFLECHPLSAFMPALALGGGGGGLLARCLLFSQARFSPLSRLAACGRRTGLGA